MDLKDNILQRIDSLLENESHQPLEGEIAELVVTTTKLFEILYGTNSTQLDLIETMQKQAYDVKSEPRRLYQFRSGLYGCLEALKADLSEGRIVDLQSEARGEVFGDFIALARRALDENEKDVRGQYWRARR